MSLKKKAIRATFRESVFTRDKHRCVICGDVNNLDAHHIIDRHNMPNGGYILENGVTLCTIHHLQAEHGIITPRELYERIYYNGMSSMLSQE
jgi:5-methylcytosine-specific restriction endonuclease McrA